MRYLHNYNDIKIQCTCVLIKMWATSLKHDPWSGRPADVISREIIDRSEKPVLNDGRITITELASECGISNGSIYSIIKERLHAIGPLPYTMYFLSKAKWRTGHKKHHHRGFSRCKLLFFSQRTVLDTCLALSLSRPC